jgi:hypothetical protein
MQNTTKSKLKSGRILQLHIIDGHKMVERITLENYLGESIRKIAKESHLPLATIVRSLLEVGLSNPPTLDEKAIIRGWSSPTTI